MRSAAVQHCLRDFLTANDFARAPRRFPIASICVKCGSFDGDVLAQSYRGSPRASRHMCDIVVNFVGFVTRLRILRSGISSP